ncbi:MAG: hypothetical protein WCI43_09380, partial [Candidatus Firestonebacteria bacterium]
MECLITDGMKEHGYEDIQVDKAGNISGTIKSNRDEGDLVILSHMDTNVGLELAAGEGFKNGIVNGLFAGALMKSSLAALSGNIVFACASRLNGGEFGAEYLFGETLKNRKNKIKGVLLCEPTGLNVFLGHKGRMEYEIEVSGQFVEKNGGSRMQVSFPLIRELARISDTLPSDDFLGKSNISVRHINDAKALPGEPKNGVRLTVDRVFIPQEERQAILSRAKSVAENVYAANGPLLVNTSVVTEKVRTAGGLEFMLEKKHDPWLMDPMHCFIQRSMEALSDAGIKAKTGYWKKALTLGSLTCGRLKLPTLGFGPLLEDTQGMAELELLSKAVYGAAWIAQKAVGIPSFGWTSDDF